MLLPFFTFMSIKGKLNEISQKTKKLFEYWDKQKESSSKGEKSFSSCEIS